jgi:hypothetical protein
MEAPMSREISRETPTLPVTNYSPSVSRAIAWLGDRYLLAKPINGVPRLTPTRRLTALTALTASTARTARAAGAVRAGLWSQTRQPKTSFQRRGPYG